MKKQRLAHLRTLIEEYEAEHGTISVEEIAKQQQADKDAAALLRAAQPDRRPKN